MFKVEELGTKELQYKEWAWAPHAGLGSIPVSVVPLQSHATVKSVF